MGGSECVRPHTTSANFGPFWILWPQSARGEMYGLCDFLHSQARPDESSNTAG